MALLRFRGPAVITPTEQQAERPYPPSFYVLACLHNEATAARTAAREAIALGDVDALATAIRQLAEAETQARTLTDLLEMLHWEAQTRVQVQEEASEALALPDMTDEEMDRWEEEQSNADAAYRGAYR